MGARGKGQIQRNEEHQPEIKAAAASSFSFVFVVDRKS